MAGRIDRLLSLTPAEVSGRLGEKVRTLRERFGERPEDLLNAEFGGTACAGAPMPVTGIPALIDAGGTAASWGTRFPGSVAREISLAEEIISGRIPVFSSFAEHPGGIDWHLEPVSGKRAPVKFYGDIDTLDPGVAGDPKHIWEINRCNFLVTLGRAYAATGRRDFYDSWRGIVGSWIEDNPYNRGINWESSLELAVRAVNWLWSAALFSPELAGDEEAREMLRDSLYLHGRHIERHLSRYFSPNTHLTGEALGLLYIGKAYPCLRDSDGWVKTAEEILEAELRRQVLPDGGYFEMATWYHRYTVDFYISYMLLSGRHEEGAREIFRKAVRHLVLLAAPDGTVPLIGDSDGGRLLFLSPEKGDVRGACCAASVILGDGELKYLCGGGFEEEALWLLGTEGGKEFEKIEAIPPRSPHSVNPDTGLYCMRTGMGTEDSALIIDCGPHGWRNGGHAHSDLLSIVLFSRGDAVLVDPGTYTYSGSKQIRDGSRSSLRHNTVSLNGLSQSEPGGTFGWSNMAKPTGAECLTGGDIGFFRGAGITGSFPGGRLARFVFFFGDRMTIIRDMARGSAQGLSAVSNLQFGEGRFEDLGGLFGRFIGKGGDHYVRILGQAEPEPEAGESEIYPDYAKAVTAPRLRVGWEGGADWTGIYTVIGRDRGLLEGLELLPTGIIASPPGGVSLRLEAELSPDDGDFPDISGFAVLKEDARTMVILRNGSAATGADGAPVLELEETTSFTAAVIEKGETTCWRKDDR